MGSNFLLELGIFVVMLSFLAALSKICSKPGVYNVYMIYIWGMVSVFGVLYAQIGVMCVFFINVDMLLSCWI